MAGVTVTTPQAVGAGNAAGLAAAAFFIAGITERGPVNVPTRVTSLAGYESVYGPRTSFSGPMHDAAQTYFAEGGSELYVARVVGTTPVVGSVTLLDRAATALPTLKVSALNPGQWSAELSVAVANGTTGVTITVYRAGQLIETYPNLPDVPSIVTALFNSPTVRAINLNSATTGANALPAVAAATALAGGDSDRTTVTAAKVSAGLALFGADLGSGAVALPGYSADIVGAAVIAHADTYRRVALLSAPPGSDETAMKGIAASLLSTAGKSAGLFGPYVLIPNSSGTLLIDPTSFIAGIRARTINASGFAQRPAGVTGRAQFVVGTEYPVDEAMATRMQAASVSGIVTYPFGIENLGWYSLSTDITNYGLLSAQDTINYVAGLIKTVLHPFLWQPIDGDNLIFGEIAAAIEGVVRPLRDARVIYPKYDKDSAEIDPGYSITVDSTLNPTNQLGNNSVQTATALRLSPTVVDLFASIVKVRLNDAV